MKIKDLVTQTKTFHDAELGLLQRKGADYSPGDDTLACFKRIAKAYDVDPMLVAAVYLEKHLDAIRTYIKKGRLNAEDLFEHTIDARNYLNLIYAIDQERSEVEDSIDRRPR